MPVTNAQLVISNRVDAIRAYHQQTGVTRAQLDISGGIDSACMLGLLVEAVGVSNITAAYSGIHSSQASHDLAHEVADTFGVPLISLDVSKQFDALINEMRRGLEAAGFESSEIDRRLEVDGTVLGSIRSCLRAPIGRGLNRLTDGGIRHGTGNECEDRFIRFYQKGGDGEVDSNPIAMLSKGEVYQVSLEQGVPTSIIEAVPTPDLQAVGENHNDEDELFALTGVRWTYSRIDPQSGHYTKVGTIEQMSRFLDKCDDQLFAPTLESSDMDKLQRLAAETFINKSPQQILALLQSARRLEATTRHKMNPNCPTFGERSQLLGKGLTDSLPNPSK